MRLEGTAGEEAVERGIAAQVVIARRCRKPARTCCGRLPVARPALFRRVLARSPYICPMPASGASRAIVIANWPADEAGESTH